MRTERQNIVLQAAIERARRERLALSATWASWDKTTAATIKARRMREWTTGDSAPHILPRVIGHAGNVFGPLRRTARDSQPPQSVVTELHFPNPEPGRPFPGAGPEAILAWNVLVLSRDPR